MGQTLVEQLLPTLDKLEWPESPDATPLGRQAYQVGLDKADEYKGDPKTLVSAIRIFRTGESRPYAFAGTAYTLLKAAREKDGSYAQNGLDAALVWLERAQEMVPDDIEINMNEAYIYIYGGRFDDARVILDYLEGIDPGDFYVIMAEVAYWQQQGFEDETVAWYKKAIGVADTVPRKMRLRHSLGDCYLDFGRYDEALEIYQEALHFNKKNPWLWHKMSLAYWQQEYYHEAQRCNQQALALEDFPEAREMKEALKQKLGTGGLTGRLFGR